MLEVEAKVRLVEPEGLRRRLRELGARSGAACEQVDVFFSHPARDLASTDEALRLRASAGRLELTYKGPRQPGAVKSREELTVVVDSDPTALLQALGFVPLFRLRKRREAWRLGEAEVALDRLEGLGAFAEVEAPTTRHVEAALAALGLASLPREAKSYLELALAAGAVERL
ncbi:MAG TPA: class IV adenylate cyclase [Candidatus Thermoplasmatota archaeon]|nr:class IV adenylate cyclase [Candidatus Thermoplasmatota archaeon]